MEKTNRKQWLSRIAVPLLIITLVVSAIINFNLYSKKTEMGREINITWNNTISELYAQANQVTSHSENMNSINMDLVERRKKDLTLINQRVDNLKNLPYAKEIAPHADRQRIEEFINYHQQVLNLVQKDLTQGEVISSKNIDRLKAVNQGWEVLVRKLNTGENNVDPIKNEFDSDIWRDILIDALTAFDQVELLPLPAEE
ncbi:hypothetical protein GCM10011351_29060 [Paraliobacillus quinghaiensis]|uniref:Uncharacterized protein n=1 Tax=Paraliobacillus quinghaiensis TaxID=470815 RepID=A0A917TW54_9BACI|nr:hypothetical protein [Paraliobacillus quinghaiensis]GGM41022.1 hypothetical protein GCM10011351_29060 [Paraliobacillus quinghaiensis]